MLRRLLLAVVLVAALASAPSASALWKGGFTADCYTWHPTVCSNGSCTTYTCDQCDYYYGGVYVESDYACY